MLCVACERGKMLNLQCVCAHAHTHTHTHTHNTNKSHIKHSHIVWRTGLYEKREGRVREERDAAQAAAEAAQKACTSVEVHLAEAVARGDTLAAELNKERHAAAAALEASVRLQAEVDQLSGKLVEVEGEMRALLEAVERQKLASVSKMRQLASFLTDLG